MRQTESEERVRETEAIEEKVTRHIVKAQNSEQHLAQPQHTSLSIARSGHPQADSILDQVQNFSPFAAETALCSPSRFRGTVLGESHRDENQCARNSDYLNRPVRTFSTCGCGSAKRIV
jgi:hypothetical protein